MFFVIHLGGFNYESSTYRSVNVNGSIEACVVNPHTKEIIIGRGKFSSYTFENGKEIVIINTAVKTAILLDDGFGFHPCFQLSTDNTFENTCSDISELLNYGFDIVYANEFDVTDIISETSITVNQEVIKILEKRCGFNLDLNLIEEEIQYHKNILGLL